MSKASTAAYHLNILTPVQAWIHDADHDLYVVEVADRGGRHHTVFLPGSEITPWISGVYVGLGSDRTDFEPRPHQ